MYIGKVKKKETLLYHSRLPVLQRRRRKLLSISFWIKGGTKKKKNGAKCKTREKSIRYIEYQNDKFLQSFIDHIRVRRLSRAS